MIFKNNDTRVEKPYDTRICRNMIITWATLSISAPIHVFSVKSQILKVGFLLLALPWLPDPQN
jgi:hypothetical protein